MKDGRYEKAKGKETTFGGMMVVEDEGSSHALP
jgi:hypothetical protein